MPSKSEYGNANDPDRIRSFLPHVENAIKTLNSLPRPASCSVCYPCRAYVPGRSQRHTSALLSKVCQGSGRAIGVRRLLGSHLQTLRLPARSGRRSGNGIMPDVNGQPAPSRGSLLRILGVGFGLAVIVGNTIGAGILRTPGEIAKYLPSPWIFLTVWVVGGLYALLGSFSMAELGAMMPRSGGY